MTTQQQNSRSLLVGSMLTIVASVIAICPLSFDFLLGGFSENKILGTNIMKVVILRLIAILLAVIFSVIFLVRNKSSRVLASILVLLEIVAIVLPFVFMISRNVVTESTGGLFASVFLIIALVGGVIVAIDSFKRSKE